LTTNKKARLKTGVSLRLFFRRCFAAGWIAKKFSTTRAGLRFFPFERSAVKSTDTPPDRDNACGWPPPHRRDGNLAFTWLVFNNGGTIFSRWLLKKGAFKAARFWRVQGAFRRVLVCGCPFNHLKGFSFVFCVRASSMLPIMRLSNRRSAGLSCETGGASSRRLGQGGLQSRWDPDHLSRNGGKRGPVADCGGPRHDQHEAEQQFSEGYRKPVSVRAP